jgi:glycosyltransferase involved in cell wall biosynthesis
MRIAIDMHTIGGRLTGNERYIQNIAEQLITLDGQNEYFLFFSHEEAMRRWLNRAPNVHVRMVSRNPLRRLGFDFVRQLAPLRAQVFHYQYTGPLLNVTPEVATIHDVSFERHPEFFAPLDRLRLRLTVRRATKSARRIITVSEFSKAEIVRLLRVSEQKVKVIYNGVGPEFQPTRDPHAIQRCLKEYAIRQPYLLAVGNISPRKNHLGMLRGFARWLSRSPSCDHRLILAGKSEGYVKELELEMARLALDGSRVKLLGYVREENLPCLYAGAALLLNTSLYEGFGLPILEAMACGIPVVASRSSCFPEIAGNAARYVNPDEPEEIADAIEELLGNKTGREEIVQRGLCRARLFRWDAAARETLKIYNEAVH